MKWIDAGDIRNWITGKQRHCQQTLPELVRRLIFATTSSVEEIDFPSGDSIATGGWDGRLKTAVVVPFFPNGTSGWEIGVEKSPGKKAWIKFEDSIPADGWGAYLDVFTLEYTLGVSVEPAGKLATTWSKIRTETK